MPRKNSASTFSDKDACGFIYPIINWIISHLYYLNLVELLKFIAGRMLPQNADENTKLRYSRNTVDMFIVSKWVYLIILILINHVSYLHLIIVWYLIYTNLYTYFYYHTWKDAILVDKHLTPTRIKRRFVDIGQAIFFTVISFAYFYNTPYNEDFSWINNTATFKDAFIYSVSNSLIANFNLLSPKTDTGYVVVVIQSIIMIMFFTIIVVGSIPQLNCIEKEG